MKMVDERSWSQALSPFGLSIAALTFCLSCRGAAEDTGGEASGISSMGQAGADSLGGSSGSTGEASAASDGTASSGDATQGSGAADTTGTSVTVGSSGSSAEEGEVGSASATDSEASTSLDPGCPGDQVELTLADDESGVCGDGVLMGDEECDDGNQFSGDGCSSDCRKEAEQWTATLADIGATAVAGDDSILVLGLEDESWGVGRIDRNGRVIDIPLRTPDELVDTFAKQLSVSREGGFLVAGNAFVAGRGHHVLVAAYDADGGQKWLRRFDDIRGFLRVLHHGSMGRSFVASADIHAPQGVSSVVHALDPAGDILWSRHGLAEEHDEPQEWVVHSIEEDRRGHSWVAISGRRGSPERGFSEIVELDERGATVQRVDVGDVENIILRADASGQLFTAYRLLDEGYYPTGGYRLCRFPAAGIGTGAASCDESWAGPEQLYYPLEILLDECGRLYLSYLKGHLHFDDLTPIWSYSAAHIDAFDIAEIGTDAQSRWSAKCSMNGGAPHSTVLARDGHLYHRHGRLLTQFWLR